MDARREMESALRRIVVAELRRAGFTGSFPHFRRLRQAVDLVSFQFDRHGGGFVIEVATGDPSGFTTHWGKHIPANKLTAWDLHPDQRRRLKPISGSGTGLWFKYDGSQPPDNVAANALSLLRQEYPLAEPGTAPNGGPATRQDNSGVMEGPPSVS